MTDDLLDLDQIVRRNRLKIVLLTAVSGANYALVLSAFAWALVFGSIYKVNEDADISGALQLSVSAVLGLAGAAVVVGAKLWGARERTIKAIRATEIADGQIPLVDNLLSALAVATGTHPVRAALLVDDAPNAMAVGVSPKKTVIVVTSGLLDKCTRSEVEAVLAVEMCSVRRLDTALHTIALSCAQAVIAHHHSWREDWKDPRSWMYTALTYPSMVVAELVRMAAFHVGDFGADAMAVKVTRNPEALRGALSRLDADDSVVNILNAKTAPLWFEPVPRNDPERASEFRRFAGTPTLRERRDRLPYVSSRG